MTGNFVLERLEQRGSITTAIAPPLGRRPLSVMPTSAGHEIRSGPGYDWDGRKRGNAPFTIIQHTIDGEGNLRHENRIYRLGAGETMILTVPHNHRYWLEPDGHWQFFWLSMTGEEALRLHRDMIDTAGPVQRLSAEAVDSLARACLGLLDQAEESAGRLSSIAYAALMALHDDVFGKPAATDGLTGVMRRVEDYIAGHLERPISVSELARVAGMSRAHFTRLFTAASGLPPAEYVLRQRLGSAARLLVQGARLPVKEIAILTGFADPNYFAKAFRRHYGISPTDYRTTGMYSSIGRP